MTTLLSQETLALIKSGVEDMTGLEIVIAPWLVMESDGERLRPYQHDLLVQTAHELAVVYNSGKIMWWETQEIPLVYRENAYYEVLLSTAAYLSYMRLGTLVITDEMIAVAQRLVKSYISTDGGAVLLSVYARVMTYLTGQLLDYYGRVPETAFISGEWHRPWTERLLDKELESGLQHRTFAREIEGDVAYLKLTEKGRVLYQLCKSDLEYCGYLKQREHLIRAANFTNMDDYEAIVERHIPNVGESRRQLLGWSGIREGMKVLELGCGAGALTVDQGLYQLVGEIGLIMATDPSVGMLARAQEKLDHLNIKNVQLVQGTAEKIPFPDNTFDAVTGSMFLHFTDIPKALTEIRRVLKPGGVFATLYSLDISKAPFFVEWFQPLLQQGLLQTDSGSVMPGETVVVEAAKDLFSDVECVTDAWRIDCRGVESVVRFLIQAGSMADLNSLPWKARQELFGTLIERGYTVKEKYGEDAMFLTQPGQWFKGIAVKESL